MNLPQSYWLTFQPESNYPQLQNDLKIDVAIIGGGISGLLSAYWLQKAGVQTAIFEAQEIAKGTSAHTTAKITAQHGLKYAYLKKISGEIAVIYAAANQAAIKHYHTIIKENNFTCDFTSQTAYLFTQEEKYIEKIKQETKAAESLGFQTNYLTEIPLPINIKAGLAFSQQAQFHPRKFLLALAKKLTRKKVSIYEHTRITQMTLGNNYLLETSTGKKIIAEKVIMASHYPFYNYPGFTFSKLYLERSYITAVSSEEKFPGGMYINAETPTRSIRSQITPQGELILIAGEHHLTGQSKDTSKHYQALWNFARKHFPIKEKAYHWSAQDCMTLDTLPYVGQLTDQTPGLYLATGYGKWGMTNSMAAAIILKDLIVQGESDWLPAYNPNRKTISASAKTFISQNINKAGQFIEGKIKPIPSKIKIKPGEGKILNLDGERVGVFLDTDKTLYLVNTTCTHLGCELNWNTAECTWDCPCHGSRFSYQGEIIAGPAVKPLKKYTDTRTIQKLLEGDF